ncbi:hypothetical protein SAMN02745196_02316 [Clostridium collagenovorans DSM 3089]|uniref:Uncharacterized protein n=1 Tax=Clostridium collagenovorans DSM 3089 TaxID=1121306 RepID=A0A1M5XM83_9CLOT|nr:hypothetical protein [Clostridium collagenovorans]SHI00965.1 hypothetical protein SAMN02745196_02316 [Clostridium collagenovorans DSM 3089]
MAEAEIKYYDVDDLTKENSYYAQLIFRILRKDGNKITKFNKDNHLILKIVQDLYNLLKDSDEIELERAKIELSIKIAARNERYEVFTIEKFIKDDTGDFYAGD